jgi:hypothetical protein
MKLLETKGPEKNIACEARPRSSQAGSTDACGTIHPTTEAVNGGGGGRNKLERYFTFYRGPAKECNWLLRQQGVVRKNGGGTRNSLDGFRTASWRAVGERGGVLPYEIASPFSGA